MLSVRDHAEINSMPVIFTKELFQNGFSALINAISAYVSNGSGHRESQAPAKPVTTFELMLEENELWIKVIFENRSTEKFCVQKFNEGVGGEESALFKFVKGLFTSPRTGEKRAKLLYKWETTSKHINRIRLPVRLKEAFFKKPHGSSFQFGGLRVQLSSNVDDVLSELREGYLKDEC